MDTFLREIQTSVFREWLSNKHNSKEDGVYIEDNYAHAEINFYDQCLIEMSLTNKLTNDIDFYLHFRFENFNHALKLYEELLQAISETSKKKTLKILLSCSTGLTTSMFASEIQEACTIEKLDYQVEAIGYREIEKVGNDYDMILLAPQIGFEEARIQSIFHYVPVKTIPASIFAKYDVSKALQLIKEIKDQKNEEEIESLDTSVDFPHHILVLGIIRSARHVTVHSQVYYKGEVILCSKIVKDAIELQDIDDHIIYTLTLYPDLKYVGIATGGIIYDGIMHKQFLTTQGVEPKTKNLKYPEYPIVSYIEERHPQLHVSLDNNADATAYGIYHCYKGKYKSLVYYLFPRGYYTGGMGVVINDELILGAHHIAGQTRYSTDTNPEEVYFSEEGNRYSMSRVMANAIAYIDPEVIVYYNCYVQDIDKLKESIEQYIPHEFMPEIKKLENISNCLLNGEMLLTIKRFSK